MTLQYEIGLKLVNTEGFTIFKSKMILV